MGRLCDANMNMPVTSSDEFGSFRHEELSSNTGWIGQYKAPHVVGGSAGPPDPRPLPDDDRWWNDVDSYEDWEFRNERWEHLEAVAAARGVVVNPVAHGPVWLGSGVTPRPRWPTLPFNTSTTSWKSVKDDNFVRQFLKRIKEPESNQEILTSLQTLPDDKSPVRFELFRQWLQTCNEYHRCFPPSGQLPLPKRVLEVLDHQNADVLRLRCMKQGEMGRFVALSHRWSTVDNFCTYQCNIQARQEGIDFESLPKRFQDAVTITRKLGISFLWIDSICIIQSHIKKLDGCPDECHRSNDLNIEIGKMEEYFGSSYCTIAATSVTHRQVNEGFLERRSCTNDSSRAIDDFHRDVIDADLNKRGWVLQERALSRRIIHFASTQAYWECGGDDVRCETFNKLRNPAAQLLSDHEFPNSVLNHEAANSIRLVYGVFTQYSKCSLTVPSDRSIAILGLKKRLRKTFDSAGRYGILERIWHRCLLWQRADHTRMKRIPLPGSGHLISPSWSWMAYTGEIAFMEIPFGLVEWNDTVQCPIQKSGDNELKAPSREIRFVETDEQWDRLIFDEQDKKWDSQGIRCIVIGRELGKSNNDPAYYVLVVAPLQDSSGKFERVGVGRLRKRDLSAKAVEIRVI